MLTDTEERALREQLAEVTKERDSLHVAWHELAEHAKQLEALLHEARDLMIDDDHEHALLEEEFRRMIERHEDGAPLG